MGKRTAIQTRRQRDSHAQLGHTLHQHPKITRHRRWNGVLAELDSDSEQSWWDVQQGRLLSKAMAAGAHAVHTKSKGWWDDDHPYLKPVDASIGLSTFNAVMKIF